MLAKKTSPTTSPSVSSPNAPLPMTSPASASTSAWMEPPSISQATYNQSTSMSQTSKIYSVTSSGDLGQKRSKTSSMKCADYHPPSPRCKKLAKRSFNDSNIKDLFCDLEWRLGSKTVKNEFYEVCGLPPPFPPMQEACKKEFQRLKHQRFIL